MEKYQNIKIRKTQFLLIILFTIFSIFHIFGCSSFKERISSDLETKISYISGKLESCLKKEDFFLNFDYCFDSFMSLYETNKKLIQEYSSVKNKNFNLLKEYQFLDFQYKELKENFSSITDENYKLKKKNDELVQDIKRTAEKLETVSEKIIKYLIIFISGFLFNYLVKFVIFILKNKFNILGLLK
jgi:regulator of replication initiation timing